MKKFRKLLTVTISILLALALTFSGFAAEYKIGDINSDNKVNSYDALMILQSSVGIIRLSSTQATAADINRDGNVNSYDALQILRYSVGLIDCLHGTVQNITKPATSTEAGYDRVVCSDCGTVISETAIPATGTSDTFLDTENGYKYTYNKSLQGWSVIVIDTKAKSYGTIRSSINGKNVVSMKGCFSNCVNLKDASNIVIPSTVTTMENCFLNCTSLVKAPSIPSNVTNISGCFNNCKNLNCIIEINANPTSYSKCFLNAGSDESDICIFGKSSMLSQIAATGTNVVIISNESGIL